MQHSWDIQRELLPVCKDQQLGLLCRRTWGFLGGGGQLNERVRKTYPCFSNSGMALGLTLSA